MASNNSNSNGSSNGSTSSRSRSSRGSSSNGSSSRSSRGRSSSGSSSRGRSSSSSSSSRTGISSWPGQINRSVLRPVSRTVSQSSWLPYALGAVGIGALIYGLSRVSAVRSFVSPVGDMFGGNDIASDLEDSFGFEEDVRVLNSDINSFNRAM